jgi:hypothetical protein
MALPYHTALLQVRESTELFSVFQQYGLAGVVIAIFAAYIYFKDKAHKEERDEWRHDNAMLAAKHDATIAKIVEDFKGTLHDISKLMVRIETKMDDRRV